MTVEVAGLRLRIRRPRGWTTPNGRQTWLVEAAPDGPALGGYIGLSRGADGWHIGTPAERPCALLIRAAQTAQWQAL